MTYWTVPREWTGTAFILGCGPSLKHFDASVLYPYGRTIVINDSFVLMPDATVLYFHDEPWYRLRESDHTLQRFAGRYIITLGNEQVQGIHHLKNTGEDGLEINPNGLRHGYNSGYGAINLAYHFGAKRIILLGYDMKIGPHMELRWNNRPGWQWAPDKFQQIMAGWLPRFETLKQPLESAGVEVINCTPDSALKTWPNRPLGEVLNSRHDECRTRVNLERESISL